MSEPGRGVMFVSGRLLHYPFAVRYGVAIVAAAVGLFVRMALDPFWGDALRFPTFYAVVMASAWIGGFGPGLVTTFLGILANDFFYAEPRFSLGINASTDVAAFVVFASTGLLISLLNEIWRRAAHAVARSEERLRVTLGSIGDAVISTDGEGRITGLNSVAEGLTGWSTSDAVGAPMERVFVILDERSRKPAESPLPRVLREGTIAGLANHTILVSRDGRETPIDDSAAPIKTADGSIVGTVLVFRDITERRRVERQQSELIDREREAHLHAERIAEELRHVQAITDVALSSLNVEELCRAVLSRVRTALRSDTATILLLDPDGAHLTPIPSDGLETEVGGDIRIPVGRGVAGRIAAGDQPVILDDLDQTEAISPILRSQVKSLVGVPLKSGSRLMGVLHAGASMPRQFTQSDAHLLSLAADRIGAAIERARLHEREQEARHAAETASEQLRAALEAGRMGTWEYVLGTGHVKWSPGLEAIHGLDHGTFPGTFEAVRAEIHEDDRERVMSEIRTAVDERRDHHVEYRIVRRDGAIRWVEGRGQLVCDDAGRPDRMVGVCLDVTERKHAEETLHLAIEAVPAAMVMVDANGAIVMVNALTEQILGYDRQELVGRSVEMLVPFRFLGRHAGDRAAFFTDPQQRPMGAGRELYAARKDGSEVPVEIGLSPIHTATGTFVLAAVTDISERKAIEQQRADLLAREQAARIEVERASHLKDEFLAVLSHELRTPLNAILGYANLLAMGALEPDRAAHALNAIQRNAQAQARLISSLLDLSRILAGKLELDVDDLDISQVIDGAVDVIRPDADAKSVRIDVEKPTATVMLRGDSGRLQQVFWNLLSNAVKFTDRGGHVAIAVDKQDEHVRVRVSDYGHGIRPELLPHVFDRFRQGERHGKGSTAGLGLGLAVVREMVEAHRGSVGAHSAGEGLGSTFTVTLPLLAAGSHDATPVRPIMPTTESMSIDVLVVDDEGDVRDLLAFTLVSRGARVQAVSSAGEALELIASCRFDVMLADLRMPDGDGYELIRTLRAREDVGRLARLAAIAVTAYAAPSDRERAITAGYDSHVAKPVDTEELMREIARVIKAAPV